VAGRAGAGAEAVGRPAALAASGRARAGNPASVAANNTACSWSQGPAHCRPLQVGTQAWFEAVARGDTNSRVVSRARLGLKDPSLAALMRCACRAGWHRWHHHCSRATRLLPRACRPVATTNTTPRQLPRRPPAARRAQVRLRPCQLGLAPGVPELQGVAPREELPCSLVRLGQEDSHGGQPRRLRRQRAKVRRPGRQLHLLGPDGRVQQKPRVHEPQVPGLLRPVHDLLPERVRLRVLGRQRGVRHQPGLHAGQVQVRNLQRPQRRSARTTEAAASMHTAGSGPRPRSRPARWHAPCGQASRRPARACCRRSCGGSCPANTDADVNCDDWSKSGECKRRASALVLGIKHPKLATGIPRMVERSD
jgi:hypothetical protein